MMAAMASVKRWVYPRPRGGTGSPKPYLVDKVGLSPPTRGNLRDVGVALGRRRSIPAHAGEPWTPAG